MPKESNDSVDGDFSNFEISKKLVERLQTKGIKSLFPVQSKTFDFIRSGDDVIVLARTGTGKTLAFALPIVEGLLRDSQNKRGPRSPSVIVLAPTRELVSQISTEFQSLCADELVTLAVYGGVPIGPQCYSLRKGVDILMGTPGRVMDLIGRDVLKLDGVKHVILDEVDRMLDMGFSKDVESIISSLYDKHSEAGSPKHVKPQTLLFSATLPNWVSSVASKYLSPNKHHVSLIEQQDNKTALNVTHLALPCPYQERASMIADVIRTYCKSKMSRCIVFCERKKDADELAAHTLMSADCHVFHGDIPQDKRELILEKFREGKYKTLITTNVAARGLDIPEVDLVIQCQPPKDVEDYIHRSGRTGRAERCGTSIVFYTVRERSQLTSIEHRVGITFRRISAPSLQDILGSWETELIESLASIPEKSWSVFIPAAQKVIRVMTSDSRLDNTTGQICDITDASQQTSKKRKSDVLLRALCCSLAHLSGKSDTMESRSLLNAQKGWTTYKLVTPVEAYRKGMAYTILREQLPDTILDGIKNLSFIQGRKGFVFDIPTKLNDTVAATWKDESSSSTLEVISELPELEPEASDLDGFTNGGNRGMSYGRSFHRGGRGNFRGRGTPRDRPFNHNGRFGGGGTFTPRHNSLSFNDSDGPANKRARLSSSNQQHKVFEE